MGSKRNWLAPKVVVGLAVGAKSICVVQAINTLKGPLVKQAAFRDLENPDVLPQAAAELLREMKLKHDWVVTCLPSSAGFVRKIPLPFRKVSKIERIIKYQLEPYLPLSVEEMAVDFLPPDPEGSALVAAVQAETISEHLEKISRKWWMS